MLLAALSVAVVSGCATYPSGNQQQVQYVLGNDTAKSLQDENLNGFLAQAPTGDGCLVQFDEITLSTRSLGDPRDGS